MLRRWIPALTASLLSVIVFACTAGEAMADVGMTVQPLVIQFKADPGVESFAKVSVNNSGSEALRVTVQQIDWRTTVEGSVKMERVGAEGTNSLNPYLKISAPGFMLAPGEARELTIAVRMPAEYSAKSASTWGGFFIRGAAASGPLGAVGPAATVLAYNTIGAPASHLQLLAMRVEQTGPGTARMFVRLRNDGVNFVRPSARLILAVAGRVVSDSTIGNNTVFPGDLRVVQHNFSNLTPGQYRLDATFDYGGDTLVEGVTNFTVK